MQKIHCIVDCLSYALRTWGQLDHRPLYFGIWDAAFGFDESGNLTYFENDQTINRDKLTEEIEVLYGNCGFFWNMEEKSDESRILELEHQAEIARDNNNLLIIGTDIFYLPYLSHSYQIRHSPHYIIVSLRADGEWYIVDPYFSWEGSIEPDQLYQALGYKNGAAFYTLDRSKIKTPTEETLSLIFEQRMKLETNPLCTSITDIVQQAIINEGSMKSLSSVLSLTSLIVQRKNSYYYTLSFFCEKLNMPKEEIRLQEMVTALLSDWKKACMLIIRIGITERQKDVDRLILLLQELNDQELLLKSEVWKLYVSWKELFVTKNSDGGVQSCRQ